jgi:hypothetical protein
MTTWKKLPRELQCKFVLHFTLILDAVGCLMLVVGCLMLVVGGLMLVVGCLMLGLGCLMLALGCLILVVIGDIQFLELFIEGH